MITNVNHVVYNFFFLTNVHYVIGQHDPHLTKTFTPIYSKMLQLKTPTYNDLLNQKASK